MSLKKSSQYDKDVKIQTQNVENVDCNITTNRERKWFHFRKQVSKIELATNNMIEN